MRQKAEESALAVVHFGGLRVTPDTGSPIEEAGIVVPSLLALQSASVIVAIASGKRDAGAGMAALSAVLLSRLAVHPLKPSAHTVTAHKVAVEVQHHLDGLDRTFASQETQLRFRSESIIHLTGRKVAFWALAIEVALRAG